MSKNTMSTASTYTTDCFRKIKDADTGKVEVKRWVEERQVNVTLVAAEAGIFWKGARIA